MLLTPEGEPAANIDKIMLLARWANFLQKQNEKIIIMAGMGKPTFPLNNNVAKAAKKYWETLFNNKDTAINYSHPQGDGDARDIMAQALTRWYSDAHEVSIKAENILFTVGGAGALNVIFATLNREYPDCKIITPFPHYTLYAGSVDIKNNLHPIHVMQETGYRMTCKSFARSLEQLQDSSAKNQIIFLMCDPNNPLGTIVERKELEKIAQILRKEKNKGILIVLDEAYAEMCLDGQQHTSFLSIAPDLKERIILIRSATKALSAAGERMAVLITFNQSLMGKFLERNINNCGHTPLSLQIAFAEAMNKLNSKQLNDLANYYQPKVDYVARKLVNMGAAMPDPDYKVFATFYVLADLSDLYGLNLPIAAASALNKTDKIVTDEDICYYLLFNDQLMIAPLSYFGLSDKKGYMRITCSSDLKELEILMHRLENRLKQARIMKYEFLIEKINQEIEQIKLFNLEKHAQFSSQLKQLIKDKNCLTTTAVQLKQVNNLLANLLSEIKITLARLSLAKQNDAAIKIQSYFRGYLTRINYLKAKAETEKKFSALIHKITRSSLKEKERLLLLVTTKPNFPEDQTAKNTTFKEIEPTNSSICCKIKSFLRC